MQKQGIHFDDKLSLIINPKKETGIVLIRLVIDVTESVLLWLLHNNFLIPLSESQSPQKVAQSVLICSGLTGQAPYVYSQKR